MYDMQDWIFYLNARSLPVRRINIWGLLREGNYASPAACSSVAAHLNCAQIPNIGYKNYQVSSAVAGMVVMHQVKNMSL